MNNILKSILINTISELIANEKCLMINRVKYFVDNGVLYSFGTHDDQPYWIERLDWETTEEAVSKYINFINNIEGNYVEIVDIPTQSTSKIWS